MHFLLYFLELIFQAAPVTAFRVFE